jgi:hypothetical protein
LKKSVVLFFFIFSLRSFAQPGCTDYQASNFDPWAVTNDGSCIYPNTILPFTFKCYVDSSELNETSGIANQNNNFWTHVDDANTAIYRIDTLSKTVFQKLTINNSTNYDWEDITFGDNHIYIGDVGNNAGNRTNLRFYKVAKSDFNSTSTTVNAGRINFSYSDQLDFTVNHNHHFYDCEAFFFMNDSIHMFTKGWVNRWTKHYVLPADTGTQIAQLIDSFYVASLITSAAIQGDSVVVLLGLNVSGGSNTMIWSLNKFQGSQFFSGNKRRFTIGTFFSTGQAEGICFTGANKGFITNERNDLGSTIIPAQVHEFDLNPYLGPVAPSPVIAISNNPIIQNVQACSDSGSTTFTIGNFSEYPGQNLIFSINVIPSWLSASPVTDTIAPGDSAVITLRYTSGTMPGGSYLTFIGIHSNDPFHTDKNVSFRLNVNNNPCMNFISTSDTCNGNVYFNSSSINTPDFYFWNFGDSGVSNIADPFHTYSANGNYVVTLVGCNSAGCDTVVQNVQATITGPKANNCYPVTQSYCCGIGITYFRITGPTGDVINNYSSDAIVGFEDFTCSDSGTMITNYPYALTCSTATSIAEYFKVWLDMNNDGMLDSVSEELYSDLDTVAPLHSGTITIPSLPANVYGVPLRMRIASDFQQTPQPCLNPQSGQHEDYSIILNLSTVEVNELPTEANLRVFPNPFTNATGIDYSIQQSSKIKLEVYNVLGRKVASLVDSQIQLPGHYHYQFDEQSAGIYFLTFSVNDKVFTERIVSTY